MKNSTVSTIGNLLLILFPISGVCGVIALLIFITTTDFNNRGVRQAVQDSMNDILEYGPDDHTPSIDPWGTATRHDTKEGTRTITLTVFSAGPDQEFFTKDDISRSEKMFKSEYKWSRSAHKGSTIRGDL